MFYEYISTYTSGTYLAIVWKHKELWKYRQQIFQNYTRSNLHVYKLAPVYTIYVYQQAPASSIRVATNPCFPYTCIN